MNLKLSTFPANIRTFFSLLGIGVTLLSFNAFGAELRGNGFDYINTEGDNGAIYYDFLGIGINSNGMVIAGTGGSLHNSLLLFPNTADVSGISTENARILPSQTQNYILGNSFSLFENSILVGEYVPEQGSIPAYTSVNLYRNLDVSPAMQNIKAQLTPSYNGYDYVDFGFGRLNLSGSIGLVGVSAASAGLTQLPASVFVYQNLDTATGQVTENAKLVASDGAYVADFSLSGTTAIAIGYNHRDNPNTPFTPTSNGYVYRNLDQASGMVTEVAKFALRDPADREMFSRVSLSGDMGLLSTGFLTQVTIFGELKNDIIDANNGSVYLYKGLNSAAGTVFESAKLVASDETYLATGVADYYGGAFSYIQYSLADARVRLSGSNALVGAPNANGGGWNVYNPRGAVYLYQGLDTASGTVSENVRIINSDQTLKSPGLYGYDYFFGSQIDLEGDQFVISGYEVNFQAKAFTGSVSSLTTLDVGNATRAISRISFTSHDDWIIGKTTDGNQVTLGAGDTANVTGAGRAIYIGKEGGSDANTLAVSGNVIANQVYIGSLAGNTGNTLQLESTATFSAIALRLAPGNFLKIAGNYSAPGTLLTYLATTPLQVWTGTFWQTVDANNYGDLIASVFGPSYTTIRSFSVAPTITPIAVVENVAVGSSYVTLAPVTANGGFGTTAAFLGGTAGTDQTVTLAYTASVPTLKIASDVLSLSGNAGNTFVLSLSYNIAAAETLGGEYAMRLLWLDPATGEWVNAVNGNTGGTAYFAGDGAYDSATDYHLGYYGVDTATHTVWAVVNHNSEFGAANPANAPVNAPASVPEPATGLLLLGCLAWMAGMRNLRHRRHLDL